MTNWKIKDILDPKSAMDYGAGLIGADQNPMSTGIPAWDQACAGTGGKGLANWWYVVIGGASNVGKTQFLMHLLRQASEQMLNPGLITMEVPLTGIQRSYYSRITDYSYTDLLPDVWEQLGDGATERLATSVGQYAQDERSLLVAEHDGAPSLNQILEMCYALKESGCGVIALDHLQLIKQDKGYDIGELATQVSEELRRFAHKEKILVLALSQLNRIAARERTKRPIAQDLWGGTSMESNANQVMLIDHSLVIRDLDKPYLQRTRLILDKNREGPNRVMINVEFNIATGVWREGLPDEERLWIPD
jgi:replicative DNA helicase